MFSNSIYGPACAVAGGPGLAGTLAVVERSGLGAGPLAGAGRGGGAGGRAAGRAAAGRVGAGAGRFRRIDQSARVASTRALTAPPRIRATRPYSSRSDQPKKSRGPSGGSVGGGLV